MGQVRCGISVSLDGFVAGPDSGREHPLGVGGERLHEWVYGLESWRGPHGLEGGERNRDGELLEEEIAGVGAIVMGRRMFGPVEGPWEESEPWNGWWGEDPPFRAPVFVVTHHPRAPLTLGATTFTFATGGIEDAVAQARAAAGPDRDVAVGGGASVVRQCLRAGLLDQLQLHIVPIALGSGIRLLDGLDPAVGFELDRVVDSPAVTHVRYRVVR